MSDERPWYQSGWTMLVIVIVLLVFGPPLYQNYQFSQLKRVTPQVGVRIDKQMFGPPVFHVVVHHKNPGTVRNGNLTIQVSGDTVVSEDNTENESSAKRSHSFEVWEPNEDHAFEWVFPLTEFNADDELKVSVFFFAKGCRQYFSSGSYKADGWGEVKEYWP